MKKIHFVFPSKAQAYLLQHARFPHYQCLFSDFFHAIEGYTGRNLDVTFYPPYECTKTDFLCVLNGERARFYCEMVQWNALDTRFQSDVWRACITESCWQAPGAFHDYGPAHMPLSMNNSNSGEAKPQMKQNSANPSRCFW